MKHSNRTHSRRPDRAFTRWEKKNAADRRIVLRSNLPETITPAEARGTMCPEAYRGKIRCVAFITKAQLSRLARDQYVGLGVGWRSEFNSGDQVLVRGAALERALHHYFAFAEVEQ
jgi:hypothetical protein